MQNISGNLWDIKFDDCIRCILINGTVHDNYTLVMGAGCALEAAQRFPSLPLFFGKKIKEDGLHCMIAPEEKNSRDECIIAFPTKYNYWEYSDIALIEQAAKELASIQKLYDIPKIILPRPGCGLGGLDYNTQVEPILKKHLDDHFYVITY